VYDKKLHPKTDKETVSLMQRIESKK